MAAKKPAKPEKDKKSKAGGGGGGIMALLPKLLGALSVVSGGVLLAGLYDVGHMGLVHMVEGFAIALVPLYLVGSLAAIFMGGKAPAAVAGGEEGGAMAEQFQDLQSKMNARLSSFQTTLDMMTGQDYEKLVAENKDLKAALDAIHAAEKEQIDQQVERLRAKNAELEEQIRKWAIQSVNKAITGDAEGDGDNGNSVNEAA
ncbi:hypothetical protein CSC94_15235 [Zhengella mangrovi]|uniref:Uncharacterized protein n=1 Tax=Zhengella mangrovi TaxID=1982044 RepID=A0A2G1QLD2_9HYPH|nr:hypothetical protein [Zhengella mangrovi]PHP66279.1 hypothetical protein CSC94_15235 [Zhengella mangrovi]